MYVSYDNQELNSVRTRLFIFETHHVLDEEFLSYFQTAKPNVDSGRKG